MQFDRLFFDARFIRLTHHDGISRFSVGLINALAKRVPVTAIVYDERQLKELDPSVEHVFANDPAKPSEPRVAKLLNPTGAQVVYSPMSTTGSAGRTYKLVLSQHDLIYYRHRKPPTDLSLWLQLLWRAFHLAYWPQRILLNRADGLVTVSETSKRLLKQHRLFKGEIAVVFNAAGSESKPATKPIEFAKRNKVTYIGSYMPYKNVETLIAAIAELPELELHLLSKPSAERKAELMKNAGDATDRIVWHGGVSDEQYAEILAESLVLATASFDEGFGIPVIEAQSQGIPTVISDIEIFHEIGGEAARYFDPSKPAELATQIRRLQSEPEWRAASAASLENAKRFNWDDSAQALLDYLAEL
jgi:glycosyltransferase involved in cell wall biosynthesis